MQLKVGDIVTVRYLPGSRYTIRDIGPIFILLEGSSNFFNHFINLYIKNNI